jgi:hypothetical protein
MMSVEVKAKRMSKEEGVFDVEIVVLEIEDETMCLW